MFLNRGGTIHSVTIEMVVVSICLGYKRRAVFINHLCVGAPITMRLSYRAVPNFNHHPLDALDRPALDRRSRGKW